MKTHTMIIMIIVAIVIDPDRRFLFVAYRSLAEREPAAHEGRGKDRRHDFSVELATTTMEKTRGLSYARVWRKGPACFLRLLPAFRTFG